MSPAQKALASALDDAHGDRQTGDPQTPGVELLERLLGSEAGRRALVDVAAEIGLNQLADTLDKIRDNLAFVMTSAVTVLRHGAGHEHPAGSNPPPPASEPAPGPGWVPYDYGDKTANPLPGAGGDLVLIYDTYYHGVTLGRWNDGWWETAGRSDDVHVTHWAPWNPPTPPAGEVTP